MSIESLFFELLQVAIGNKQGLSHIPSQKEWKELFDMAKKQSLVAIAFVGVTKLNPGSDYGASLGMDEMTYLKWLGLVAKTQQKNKEMCGLCEMVCKDFLHDGFRTMVLKGQSNLAYYPEDLKAFRTAGDIDLYAWCIEPTGIDMAVGDLDGKGAHYEKYFGNEAVIEYTKMRLRTAGLSDKVEVVYHHLDMPGVYPCEVEVHFRPSWMYNPWRNRRVQRWFEEQRDVAIRQICVDGHTFSVPSVSFNAVYQLMHIYRHLFIEGIGLRQLLDYYFVLRSLHIEQSELTDRTPSMAQWTEDMGVAVMSNKEIMRLLGRFGMKKFAGAVMWVLKEVFAMPDAYLLCPPNEKEGRHLLEEIMIAGNFGKYDKRVSASSAESRLGSLRRRHAQTSRFFWSYPGEAVFELPFRAFQYLWRLKNGYLQTIKHKQEEI